MKVLVTTPNGKVGQELVKLLRDARVPHRLGAHTVDKARGEFPGAEVVRLDYADPSTFGPALEGVSALYFAAPSDLAAAPQIELIEQARKAGVKKVVRLSAWGVDQAPDDAPLRAVEKHLEKSAVDYTILRPNWFFQNFSTSARQSIAAGVLAEPSADAKTAFIDTRDIAAVAFAALTQAGHERKAYALTGPELLDRSQVAAILSKEIGRPVKYVAQTDPQFREAAKPYVPAGYLELLSFLYGVVRAGHTAHKTDTVKQILGREPISLQQFARDHRAMWA